MHCSDERNGRQGREGGEEETEAEDEKRRGREKVCVWEEEEVRE